MWEDRRCGENLVENRCGFLLRHAENALKELKKKRNENPEEVPTHLLRALTTKFVCFKFTAQH